MQFEVVRGGRPHEETRRLEQFDFVETTLDPSKFKIHCIEHDEFVNEAGRSVYATGTDNFSAYRRVVRPGLQAIVQEIWRRYHIRPAYGVDIGSGPSGEMAHELIPEQSRPFITEVEINQTSVESNRELHPEATVIKGSYLRLTESVDEPVQIVTGLSCLDATTYLEIAIDEISKTLTPGGLFIHVQDIRPGELSICPELALRKEEAPYPGKAFTEDGPVFFVSIRNGAQRLISLTDLFKSRLERVIREHPDLALLEHSWTTSIARDVGSHRRFDVLHGLYNTAPTHNNFQVSALVTVAQRV